MKKFNLFFLILPLFFMLSCDRKNSDISPQNCSLCKMKISDSKTHSSSLNIDKTTHNFDDIGCMVLFSKNNQIDLVALPSTVFTMDTKKMVDSKTAHYKLCEGTPMKYGFCAYEKNVSDEISFDEVVQKMLRGEHMANPKISKQVLGDKK